MSNNHSEFIATIDKALRWKRRTVRINWYGIIFNLALFFINLLNVWAKDDYWFLTVIWLQPAVAFFVWRWAQPRMRKSITLDERLRLDAVRCDAATSPDAKIFYMEQMLMTFQEFNKLHGIKEDVFAGWKTLQAEEDRRDREGEEWKGN